MAASAAPIIALEQELFDMRRRVADAERALQVTVTKKAQEGEYLIPHRALLALFDTIPKVVAKIDQGSPNVPRTH